MIRVLPLVFVLSALGMETGWTAGSPEAERSKEVPSLEKPFPAGTGRSPGERERFRTRVGILTSRGNRISDPAGIDTMAGLSPEEKNFLRHRYRILHPLD